MSPEALLNLPPLPNQTRPLWKIWLDRFFYALLTGFLLIAMIFCMSILWDAFFNSPPVHITSLNVQPPNPLCPGDHFDVSQKVEVTKPVFLYSYTSVMDSGLNYNIFGTQNSFTPRPQPKTTVFTETFPWQVPNLPPGDYQRVVTIRGYNTSEKPVYSAVKFKVRRGCDEWDEQSNRSSEDSFDCWSGVGCDYGVLAFGPATTSINFNFWYLYYQFRGNLFPSAAGNSSFQP
jgi:hypothetical protein